VIENTVKERDNGNNRERAVVQMVTLFEGGKWVVVAST
jgi:hypothetical protein